MRLHRRCPGLFLAMLAITAIAGPSRSAAATIHASGRIGPCRSIVYPALVYALRGSVYRNDPAGRNPCRLTEAVNATEPQLAPGGRLVAFLAGVHRPGGMVSEVRVAQVGRRQTSGTIVSDRSSLHSALTWSHDGRRLAFIEGTDVRVWDTVCHCTKRIFAGTRSMTTGAPIWSPDGQRLAISLVSSNAPSRTRLLVNIVDAVTARHYAVVIHFPAWLEGNPNHPYEGSFPSQIIAWLPRGKLILGTSGYGIGLQLAGIWTAMSRGGMARLIVGTHASPRRGLKFPLLNASQALVSPDGTKLLLDPLNRFWITPVSRRAGHVLDLHIRGSCALAQVAWMGNAHLAYISVCTISGSANFLARLYIVAATGEPRKLLAVARSPQQDALSIAPPTRCVACGG